MDSLTDLHEQSTVSQIIKETTGLEYMDSMQIFPRQGWDQARLSNLGQLGTSRSTNYKMSCSWLQVHAGKGVHTIKVKQLVKDSTALACVSPNSIHLVDATALPMEKVFFQSVAYSALTVLKHEEPVGYMSFKLSIHEVTYGWQCWVELEDK